MLHLFTDNVDNPTSSRVKNITLNNWIATNIIPEPKHKKIVKSTNIINVSRNTLNHYDNDFDTNLYLIEYLSKQREISIFGQLSSKLSSIESSMDNIYRCVIPDRSGQLRIFMPTFHLESCTDEGGQYRQLFSMILSELFGGKSNTHYKLNPIGGGSKFKLRLFSKIKSNSNEYIPIYYGFNVDQLHLNKEIDVLKLFETFGRIIGLAVRSLLNLSNIPIPNWFWHNLNYDSYNNKRQEKY